MSVGSLGCGPTTVDKLLGNAYQIVKEVQENLAPIVAVAAIADDIAQVIANLNDVESTLAAALAANGGAALVGTSLAGINVQEALDARPTSVALADDEGAAAIGTSEAGVTVEEALAARPKSTVLAGAGGADLIGSSTGLSVEERLVSLVPAFVSAANLANEAHAVNTTGKFAGRLAKNTGDQKVYMAQGGATNASWLTMDGATEIIPGT